MLKRIIASLLVLLGGHADASQSDHLVELGKIISKDNVDVEERLALFVNSPDNYFKKYEEALWERGIESPQDIQPVIVLVDALIAARLVVYTDHSTEADQVLLMLNNLTGKALEKNECFSALQDEYKKSQKYNAIGNFLYNSKVGTMPMKCINQSGYSLLNIDEGSDSFVFFLVPSSEPKEIVEKASKANISIRQF